MKYFDRTLKKIIFLIFLIPMFFCSCNDNKGKSVGTMIRPVKTVRVDRASSMEKIFPGVVESEQYSYVNFRVGGMVQELKVEEGQNVKAGELIAALDPRDYNLRIEATKATYHQADLQLSRYRNLYEKHAISKQEYEMMQASYENSKAAYNQAMHNLKDTRLLAPFSGNIEKKYIENFQEVRAGEKIVKLVNPNSLQFRFILPETNTKYTKNNINCSVELDVNKGVFYQAEVKEVVSSSVEGTGLPVILVINDKRFNPKETNILPGYSCNIKVEMLEESQFISLPLSAVFFDTEKNGNAVWVVNEANQTVSRKQVIIGNPVGIDNIIIESGLQGNELIVTAGINMLSEGVKVKLLE